MRERERKSRTFSRIYEMLCTIRCKLCFIKFPLVQVVHCEQERSAVNIQMIHIEKSLGNRKVSFEFLNYSIKKLIREYMQMQRIE